MRLLELRKFGEAFVERAVVGGLIAQEEAELFGRVGADGRVLQYQGALREPIVLGQTGYQDFFGGGGGLVLVAQGGEDGVELGLRFDFVEDPEFTGEAVAQVVQRGYGLAGGGARAGGAGGGRHVCLGRRGLAGGFYLLALSGATELT